MTASTPGARTRRERRTLSRIQTNLLHQPVVPIEHGL
jgi:hypothetical protein